MIPSERQLSMEPVSPGMHRYLERYVTERGIPMPHYDTGSKIVEEAYELQEAVQHKDRAKVMEEAFDVFVTALVAVHQFGGTLEEAAEIKINKDRGRGEKKGTENVVY